MTNRFYGVSIGVNEYLEGRKPAFPAVRREGHPGYMQLYDLDNEATKHLKNMLSGEMLHA